MFLCNSRKTRDFWAKMDFTTSNFVTRGLDPRISFNRDCRVKPGNDAKKGKRAP